MGASWIDLFAAALSGGIVVKLLDYLYLEYRRRKEASDISQHIVDRHLDPVLKAADELVGKIRSLAQHDFVEFKDYHNLEDDQSASVELTNFYYLFGQFWARVQILRMEGLYVNLAAVEPGRKLKSFLDTLETRKIRLVNRPLQRGMGESLIQQNSNNLSTLTYYEFVQLYRSDENIQKWFQPLQNCVKQISHTRNRQNLLVYGVVLHSLIDTLDPEHHITQNRPSWPNKLTKKSRRDLKFRIFNIYLPCISDKDKYVEQRINS